MTRINYGQESKMILEPMRAAKTNTSHLAQTILKNASFRAGHSAKFRDMGVNLDIVMPNNVDGFRIDLFAKKVLGAPITAESLYAKFGKRAAELALVLNDFLPKEQHVSLKKLKDLGEPINGDNDDNDDDEGDLQNP